MNMTRITQAFSSGLAETNPTAEDIAAMSECFKGVDPTRLVH